MVVTFLRDQTRAKGVAPVIPKKNNLTKGNEDMGWCLYTSLTWLRMYLSVLRIFVQLRRDMTNQRETINA